MCDLFKRAFRFCAVFSIHKSDESDGLRVVRQQKDRWTSSFVAHQPKKQQCNVEKPDLHRFGLCVDVLFCLCAYLWDFLCLFPAVPAVI